MRNVQGNRRRWHKYIIASVVLLTGGILFYASHLSQGRQPTLVTTFTQKASHIQITGSDWPSYMMDDRNSSYNPNEKTLSPTNVSSLEVRGTYTINNAVIRKDAIPTSVEVVDGVLYFGSWNGYQYAVSAGTYQLLWKRFLGINTPPASAQCYPSFAGVTSGSSIVKGVLFVGGGDGNFYALDAKSGAVDWQTNLATPPNEYLWGSPAVSSQGHIYMGVSSFCDNPLIPGRLVMLDSTTGTILATHYTDPQRRSGNSIWMKPALIDATSSVIYATGNGSNKDSEGQAIVSLNANTLQLGPANTWQPPKSELEDDPDFGATCTIVPDMNNKIPGAICHNKNGTLYAVQITQSGMKEQWSLKLGYGGDIPWIGESDVAPGSFDGQTYYAATGKNAIGDVTNTGAIYAINPATGAVKWKTPTNLGFAMTALAGANGFIVAGLTNTQDRGVLVILSASDGKILFSYPLSASVFGAPSIADGEIYVPTIDGRVYDFGLPPPLQPSEEFGGKSLNANWSLVNPNFPHERLSPQGLMIDTVALSEINNVNFVATSAPAGNILITTRFAFAPEHSGSIAGIVATQGLGRYLQVGLIKNQDGTLQFQLIEVEKGQEVYSKNVDDPTPAGSLIELQILRLGNTYFGYARSDGANWLALGNVQPSFIASIVGFGAAGIGHAPYDTATFYSCSINSQ